MHLFGWAVYTEIEPDVQDSSVCVFSPYIEIDKASGGCHGIGKELIKDISLNSSHPCDNG